MSYLSTTLEICSSVFGSCGVITKYIWVGTENIASKKIDGADETKLFYHNDRLDGVHVTTDADGFWEQTVEYDPWGKVSVLGDIL